MKKKCKKKTIWILQLQNYWADFSVGKMQIFLRCPPTRIVSFFVQHLLECFCEWRKRSKDQIDESRISQWAAAQCDQIRNKVYNVE